MTYDFSVIEQVQEMVKKAKERREKETAEARKKLDEQIGKLAEMRKELAVAEQEMNEKRFLALKTKIADIEAVAEMLKGKIDPPTPLITHREYQDMCQMVKDDFNRQLKEYRGRIADLAEDMDGLASALKSGRVSADSLLKEIQDDLYKQFDCPVGMYGRRYMPESYRQEVDDHGTIQWATAAKSHYQYEQTRKGL